MVVLAGYLTGESLHQGTHSRVFRAQRVADQQPVILKTLALASPSIADAHRLRQEFVLGCTLDHPHVIPYYALEESATGPVLVIGAGEMAELAVNVLRKRGVKQLSLVNRTCERALALLGEGPGFVYQSEARRRNPGSVSCDSQGDSPFGERSHSGPRYRGHERADSRCNDFEGSRKKSWQT